MQEVDFKLQIKYTVLNCHLIGWEEDMFPCVCFCNRKQRPDASSSQKNRNSFNSNYVQSNNIDGSIKLDMFSLHDWALTIIAIHEEFIVNIKLQNSFFLLLTALTNQLFNVAKLRLFFLFFTIHQIQIKYWCWSSWLEKIKPNGVEE